ncbi:MAG: helix-turn-helix transcriptional regulator [Victivallaceae bacterium]|nr:helix-turn-helix transcriptional regulator [Victivallaceae bacterium]
MKLALMYLKNWQFPLLDWKSLPQLVKLLAPENNDSAILPIMHIEEDSVAIIRRQIDELIDEFSDHKPGYLLRTQGLMIAILVEIARHAGRQDPVDQLYFQICDAATYCHRNFTGAITLDKLAAVARMSRRNFTRRFREYMDCSPAEYLLELRLRHAEMLLATSRRGVTEIALDSGFGDGNYFSRIFREKRKNTPSQFRQKIENKLTAKNYLPASINLS